MNLAALLVGTIARLERAGVPYMITGSVASSYHGEPRATRDLLQLGDVAAMLDVGGDSLDLAYIERWVAGLGLHAPWSRARLLRSAD